MITKSVLVTGGTGNIGSAIVEELLNYDYDVSVLCKDKSSVQKAKKMGANSVYGSLQETQKWLHVIDVCDALIHTACTFDENMGFIDFSFMQQVVARVKRRSKPLILIYTSGCWTYGDHQKLITEQTPKSPTDDFQWMLRSINFLREKSNIDLRVVSPVNVVCEQSQFLPPILLWEIERCGYPTLPKDTAQTWSLIERRNLAELYRLALEKGQAGEEYIGSAEHRAPLKELLRTLSSKPLKSNKLSDWVLNYGTWTQGYGLNQVFSSDKAIRELGWAPKKFIMY